MEFSITASDVDGDNLSYYWYVNGSLQTENRSFTFIADYESAGIYNITVVVSDSELTDFENWMLQVNNVNRAPIITWYTPSATMLKIREGCPVLFNHTSSDPDREVLSYSWKLNGAEVSTSSSWLFVPTISECGNATVSLSVTDGMLTDTRTWNVSIGLRGDINADFVVDLDDLEIIGNAYGSQSGDVNWEPRADIYPEPRIDGSPEGDGRIDIFDLATVGLNYNRSC